MDKFDFVKLFNPQPKSKSAAARRRGRICRIEELESREMLAVSVVEFESLQRQYGDLQLNDYEDYNIIEVLAEHISESSLRAAIDEAGKTVGNDLIVIRTSETQNKITLTGTELAINTPYGEWGSITIVRLGEQPVILDANKQSRIFSIGSDANVALAGLTITNGTTETHGGGIRNNGTLMITHCALTENSAEYNGGSIVNTRSLTVTHSIISNSTAQDGGGVHSQGKNVTNLISNSIIENNTASIQGGGLSFWLDSVAEIHDSKIIGNSAKTGGGIFGSITMTTSVVSGNSAVGNHSDLYGGGLYTIGVSLLENCEITDNQAYSASETSAIYGGGIFNAGMLTLIDCNIAGNNATSDYDGQKQVLVRGGGIYNSNLLTVRNSTVADNKAECLYTDAKSFSSGGGIYSNSSTTHASSLFLESATVAGNFAMRDGGISMANGSIVNSIIAGNAALPGETAGIKIGGTQNVFLANNTIVGNYGVGINVEIGGADIYNTIIAQNGTPQQKNSDITLWGHSIFIQQSLIGNGDGHSALQDGVFGNIVGNADTPIDPKLTAIDITKPWTIDIWKSWDLNLTENSIAVDAGNNVWAVDTSKKNLLLLDRDGKARIVNNAVDIGAYEYGGIRTDKDKDNNNGQDNKDKNQENDKDKTEGDKEQEKDVNSSGLFPLLAPNNVKVSPATISSLYVTWDKVEGAVGYNIEYALGYLEEIESDDFIDGVMQFVSEDEKTLTYRLTNLVHSGITHHVRVIALADGEQYLNSAYSEIKSEKTVLENIHAIASVKPKVRVLRSTDISTVTLTWNPVGANAVYQIDCNKLRPHEFTVNYTISNGVITGATISGLQPNTSYRFTVTAINSQDRALDVRGIKNASVTVNVKTPRYVIPNGIKTVRTQTSLDGITLFWRPSASETNGYIMTVRSKGNEDIIIHIEDGVVVSSGQLTVTPPLFINGRYEIRINGLQASTAYTFLMQSFAAGIAEDKIWSNTVRVNASTLRYPPPAKITVAERTAENVTLTWTVPRYTKTFVQRVINDPVTHYEVYLVNPDKTETSLGFTPDAQTTVLTIARDSGKHTLFIRAVVCDSDGNVILKSLGAKITLKAVNFS